MLLACNPVIYNPDGSYNEMYYKKDGGLKISQEELSNVIDNYKKTVRTDGIVEAWNCNHTTQWNYSYCQKWCEEHSANHRF